MVPSFSIVGHDNFGDQLVSDHIPSLLFVFVSVNLDDLVYGLQDCLVSDNFFCRVDFEEVSILEQHEARLKATEHHEIVYQLFVVDVEVLASSADLDVIKLVHDVSKAVV